MIYDFKCPKCGHKEEISCSVEKLKDLEVCCYKCAKGTVMKRIYHPPEIKFVGPGFYVNDYKKNKEKQDVS